MAGENQGRAGLEAASWGFPVPVVLPTTEKAAWPQQLCAIPSCKLGVGEGCGPELAWLVWCRKDGEGFSEEETTVCPRDPNPMGTKQGS